LTATLDRKLSPFLAAVAATPAVETRAYDTSLKVKIYLNEIKI